MTGQLPVFNLRSTPAQTIIEQSNARYSTVVLMIETKESIERVEEIASVDGVEVLLIGSNDLSIELDIPGQFQDPVFRSALQKVSLACQRYGKVFGLAGIYDSPEIQSWAINDLRCRFILGQQDSGLIAGGGKKCADTLSSLLKPE
jgi:2-keto-3-deoxy-L-rhamnonate aldolase RhmA